MLCATLNILWIIECWIKKKKKVFFQRRKKCLMSKEKQLLKRMRITHQSPGKFILYKKLDTQKNKKHIRTWGTTLFSWKLLPSEYCTTPTQRKSNLAVRIASLQESWYQSDVTYFWNVTAAPNYRLFSTNKISTSRWWKTKHLTTRLSFNRSQ